MATVIPLAVLTFATLLAFVNAWPNRLVFDDKAFAGPGRAAVLDSLRYIFTHDVWAWMGKTFGLYRPLLLLQLSAETKVFGAWLQGYHLSNIFQHLIVTLLLYGFLQFLLRSTGGQTSRSRLCALLAALVFAVHPIHAEVVNSVFNRSDMMVATLALCGFWWLLYFLERHPARAWSGLAITYFLAMLCKENAIVIPGLAVILILMIKPGNFAIRVRKSLPVLWLLLPLALYLLMRANALANPEMTIPGSADPEMATAGLAAPEPAHIKQVAEGSALSRMLDDMALPSSKTLMSVSASVGTAFRIVAWPYPLRLLYGDFSPDERRFYAGLNLVLFGTALILVGRKRFVLPACLAFFYLAMLPASRLIGTDGSSGSHFADRYAYLPSIGLAILLAFFLRHLAQRIASRTLVRMCLPVLLLLTGLTWDRNADWRSEVALFGVEYERGKPTDNTLRWLTAAHLAAGNFARVVKICDEHPAEQEEYADSTYTHSCATAYERQHRYEEAERAHLYALAFKRTRVGAGMSLARFYLRRARPLDAEEYFKSAINWTNDPAGKALRTAEMILALNPKSKEQAIVAKGYIEQALHHRPGWDNAESMLKALEKALNSAQNALPDLTTPPSPQGTWNNTLPIQPGSE